MRKNDYAIPDTFLDAFMEDGEKHANQVKEELRKEINHKLKGLHNEKIKKQLFHLMELLDIA